MLWRSFGRWETAVPDWLLEVLDDSMQHFPKLLDVIAWPKCVQYKLKRRIFVCATVAPSMRICCCLIGYASVNLHSVSAV